MLWSAHPAFTTLSADYALSLWKVRISRTPCTIRTIDEANSTNWPHSRLDIVSIVATLFVETMHNFDVLDRESEEQ